MALSPSQLEGNSENSYRLSERLLPAPAPLWSALLSSLFNETCFSFLVLLLSGLVKNDIIWAQGLPTIGASPYFISFRIFFKTGGAVSYKPIDVLKNS